MKVVLDASALLALLLDEQGASKVAAALSKEAMISAVNFAEVMGRAERKGIGVEAARDAILSLQLQVVDLDIDGALEIGRLESVCRSSGLSLGDRACLATGKRLGAKILTADRVWLQAMPSLNIEVIR